MEKKKILKINCNGSIRIKTSVQSGGFIKLYVNSVEIENERSDGSEMSFDIKGLKSGDFVGVGASSALSESTLVEISYINICADIVDNSLLSVL